MMALGITCNCADAEQLSVPDGFDAEFSVQIFYVLRIKPLPSEREHVTPWLRSPSGLHWGHFRHRIIRPYYRVTVDDQVDLEVVRAIVDALEPQDRTLVWTRWWLI